MFPDCSREFGLRGSRSVDFFGVLVGFHLSPKVANAGSFRYLAAMIPEHLRPYVVEQDPSLYTPIDHASWRFILRISSGFFKDHAHKKYLDGLRETGISTERIPLIGEMDACLQKFGWRAVAVSGFIPPAIFLEFQSLGILAIACDMRTLEHLAYTPAPDIVHEAAGHAPIVADPEYRAYLLQYGGVARHAIFSREDMDTYEAIRRLSEVKENPRSSREEIEEAELLFRKASDAVSYDSEAAKLARMAWWTVEYGLVGPMDRPKIYGAGLLSSVGESFDCLGPGVKRIPFSLACIEVSYDITRPQPQLFVTPSFSRLGEVLEEFADTMAYRRGGEYGLHLAKEAKTVCTVQLDTGIGISGIVEKFDLDKDGKPSFLKFSGPCQLSFQEKEIHGQGAEAHREGFSAIVGSLADGRSPSSLSDHELSIGVLRYASGIEVEGRFLECIRKEGRGIIARFADCRVRRGSETLYRPEWGVFDLPLGISIPSVYGGAGDRAGFLKAGGPLHPPGRPKSNLTQANKPLNNLYAIVRKARESPRPDDEAALQEVTRALDSGFSSDWLLPLELLELEKIRGAKWAWLDPARERIATGAEKRDVVGTLLKRGLEAGGIA